MFKRFFDFSVALFLIVLIFPLMLIVFGLVFLKLGSPALFRQERPGLNGKIFTLYKFRSMIDKNDLAGNALPDSLRLTKFGSFLRRTSLDELPQLFNVLKGDLSLVGPRPLLIEYLPLYSSEQARRHNVRPGITGWAQVNGRNELSWQEKFNLDVWYVDNQSFVLDLKILFLTLGKVFARAGVNKKGQATTDKFSGNK